MQPRHVPSLYRALTRAMSASCYEPTTPSSFPSKTVTRSNFESSLQSLRSHVKDADFVAIDLEMTGVASAPWRESFEFDRHDVSYLKLKDSAEKFAVVQVGVCPFRWDSERLAFIAQPHNFYVFRRKELPRDDSSDEFLCQTSSINFLAEYRFDFNACIREGISYLSREQESKLWRQLDEPSHSRNFSNSKAMQTVSIVDMLFTERMKNTIKEWRRSILQNGTCRSQFDGNSNDVHRFETTFFGTRPALALSGFTAHQLRLIRLLSTKYFEDLQFVSVSAPDFQVKRLVVFRDSVSDQELLVNDVDDENCKFEEIKINSAIGFRHVIDLLSSEKKCIIGHNCFLDIAHIYKKFFGTLPQEVEHFVTSVNEHFHQIIDTKVILHSHLALQRRLGNSSTSLSSAFAKLCPQIAVGYKGYGSDPVFEGSVRVEVEVENERSTSWTTGAKHEAGYDAFMTGCLFAQVCHHLGVDFKGQSPESWVRDELLNKYSNRLYISWRNNVGAIDLATGKIITESLGVSSLKKKYSDISFENIVLMWGFPSKLKGKEIKDCICKVLGPLSVVSVYDIDETAVIIQFRKAELVSDFLFLKETLESKDDAIPVLNPIWKLLKGGSTHAVDYEGYKEICMSRMSEAIFADQANAVLGPRPTSTRPRSEEGIRDPVPLSPADAVLSSLRKSRSTTTMVDDPSVEQIGSTC
ncbi:hypothetical protein MLD38_000900 [Melastoma candidum]|uniref:Uncharacterized protein n=1 Tax=Melastoma candidum TaxID=119954 RepID=A0ACB9SDI4_9MYRT|nr:hypothetical protein MLD38_000900 [Melastoma candidum]